jgi:uncharacterized protein (DUF169 family)
MGAEYARLHTDLQQLLGLSAPPVAITFSDVEPDGIGRFDAAMPPATEDGRTGRVAAGCVFWVRATERAFVTVPDDHANCSVGSFTHGLKSMEDIAANSDVAALVAAEWVSPDDFSKVPSVKNRSNFIVYGPLRDMTSDPNVVFIRLNGKQLMMVHDAWPGARMEGKPQCHIIPIAKEDGEVAVSVGCMLSRVRTGMSNNDVSCAIPWAVLPDLIDRLRLAIAADERVAEYAAADSRRFQQRERPAAPAP